MTEFVEDTKNITGTVRDPNDEELSAAREGRRIRQPGQDPAGVNIGIVFWNANDCAMMSTAKGGELYKAVPATEGHLADAARLKRILEVNFDAGYIFGPGRASTWSIECHFDQYVNPLRTGRKLCPFAARKAMASRRRHRV